MKAAYNAAHVVWILIVIAYVLFNVGDALCYFLPEDCTDFTCSNYEISNPNDYARITDVDYKAIVVDEPGGQGKILVTERLTFDIHAAYNRYDDDLFWELWRALPEEYVDGVFVHYTVHSVKQVFDDGREPVVFEESPRLYWDDIDYINTEGGFGPGKWFHSKGPYSERNRQYECVLFYVDGLYRETVIFEIEYEMYNASLRYGDVSELYVALFSGEDVEHLNSFKGQFLFPNDIMPRPGNYSAYTYGTNARSFPFIESKELNPGYTTFAFELDESQLKFNPNNQYIEFALLAYGEDKHIFTEHAARNNLYYRNLLNDLMRAQAQYEREPVTWLVIRIVVFLALTAATVFIVKYALSIDERMKKKYKFYESPVEIEYFRDIPSNLDPNFAASLVFCKHKKDSADIKDGYAAIMLDLVLKGYIELDRIRVDRGWDNNNMKIIVKRSPFKFCVACGRQCMAEALFCTSCATPFSADSVPSESIKPLTPTEEAYYNLIVRHAGSTEMAMTTFQKKISMDYNYTETFVHKIDSAIKSFGILMGYYQEKDYRKLCGLVTSQAAFLGTVGVLIAVIGNLWSYSTRLGFAFGSFFVMGLGCLGAAIYLGKQAKKYVLLTQLGEDEYAKWRGLYNFLDSETLMNERTVVELPIWEKYLVYATAFGISEKVIKAIEIRCPNITTSPVLSNPYYRSRGFYVSSRSFRTTARSAASISHSSRGGSHGIGGGGGGGGGGH